MKVFDYLNLANPRYFKDNRMEAHSDHRYYKKKLTRSVLAASVLFISV